MESKGSSNPEDDTSFDPFFGMKEPQQSVPYADLVDSTGQPILQQSVADTLINAEVFLPHGDDLLMAKVL